MAGVRRTRATSSISVRAAPGGKAHIAEGTDPNGFARLVGLMVAQARHDGMEGMTLGADSSARTLVLEYHGRDQAGTRRSWQVSAPPYHAYSALVKAVVAATTFVPGCEPTGTISAHINGECVDIKVRIVSWTEVHLSWAPPEGSAKR